LLEDTSFILISGKKDQAEAGQEVQLKYQSVLHIRRIRRLIKETKIVSAWQTGNRKQRGLEESEK
jgi:hypothetical protein